MGICLSWPFYKGGNIPGELDWLTRLPQVPYICVSESGEIFLNNGLLEPIRHQAFI